MNLPILSAGSRYSDEDRRNAVAHFVVLGDCAKVARAVGIPERTLRDWCKSAWWDHLSAEVRREKDGELDAKLTHIIDTAAGQLRDRIENGDAVLIDGNVQRRPMSGRDLAIAMAVVYDKRQLLRNRPTTVTASSDRLTLLMVELERRGGQLNAAIVEN